MRSNRRTSLHAVFSICTLCAVSTPAIAHHPGAEQHPGHATVTTQAKFDFGSGRYRHDGIRADVLSWNLGGERAFNSRIGAGLRMGLHTVARAGGPTETGPGDLELNLKIRLGPEDAAAPSGWIGGVSLELPTGDDDKGLGSGHTEFSPFTAFMRRWGRANIHGGLSGIFSLKDESHDHGASAKLNFVNPHAEKELRGHLGSNWSLGSNLYVNGVLAMALPVSGDHKGDVLLDARPEAGITLGHGWTVSVVAQLPLTEERRFDYQSIIQARKRF